MRDVKLKKRNLLGLALLSFLALVGLVVSPPTAANANVNDFTYAYWGSDYTISLDAKGRAHAHVVETLVARFPDYDQNRGIVRGLTTSYQGSSLHTRVISVTDEHGDRVPYETEREDGILYLLLGTDDYVHGLQTYVIEYELRDVILAADDTERDEFYWNLLPLQSTQAIEQFEGNVTFTGELARQFTGDAYCYQGYARDTHSCELTGPVQSGADIRFVASAQNLPPGWGYTFAIGFASETVTQPTARSAGTLLDATSTVALAGGAGVAAVGGFAVARARRRSRSATGIIVAQYEISPDVPPLLAAALYPGARSAVPAQMVHLAVNGVLKIAIDSKSSRPRLHLANRDAAKHPLDIAMRDQIFSGGALSFTVPSRDESFSAQMRALVKRGVDEAVESGLLVRASSTAAKITKWLMIALVAVALIAGFVSIALGRPSGADVLFGTFAVGGILGAIALGIGAKRLTHTTQGALMYEHLEGLREFIRVAEADRLRMLQSVQGAETYQSDSLEITHLYERLLPYAMLFGEEKSWGKVLETAYESSGQYPFWFNGYNTSGFSTQFSSFSASTASASTYTAPSSSSSGGSFGGGFSGGGGGGGFSGGR